MAPKMIGFVDGENLILRYEAMLKDGRRPVSGTQHVPGNLIWHFGITKNHRWDVVRVSYYQTFSGDDDGLEEARANINNVRYPYQLDVGGYGEANLCPMVFKKQGRSQKTKSVDINLTVDTLRQAFNPAIDIVFFASGDGDYLPLLEEVSRHGKQIWVAAFSSGLSKKLKLASDVFVDLDRVFF